MLLRIALGTDADRALKPFILSEELTFIKFKSHPKGPFKDHS